MIGLVLITHAHLGRELINAAEFILGKIEASSSVAVEAQMDSEMVSNQLKQAIKAVDHGHGVLVLTDMFGGTPNNISLTFLDRDKVEVITGVNLPMLIKAATSRQDKTLSQLAAQVAEAGQGAITVAGEFLSA